MRKKTLEARRQKNREIAERDAKHRCAYCRQALTARFHIRILDNRPYCSTDCMDAMQDWERAEGR